MYNTGVEGGGEGGGGEGGGGEGEGRGGGAVEELSCIIQEWRGEGREGEGQWRNRLTIMYKRYL